MNPTEISRLESLLKVGALTFCGAFFTALTFTSIPSSVDGWKNLILPALTAAIASEILYLRGELSKALAKLVSLGTVTPALPAAPAGTTTTTTASTATVPPAA
jgi:hypothetical protein